ncbi:hypothetical protein, partial [Candidatus Hakubella thermalkaliphila]|uniref:hypothetical protein n=1 Tax=Candidatus Hakubella thermalkaliphila TaxID=2754717 RepID=UPI001C6115F7
TKRGIVAINAPVICQWMLVPKVSSMKKLCKCFYDSPPRLPRLYDHSSIGALCWWHMLTVR